jgi:hypothetical protein
MAVYTRETLCQQKSGTLAEGLDLDRGLHLIVVIHESSKQQTITRCVNSAQSEMAVTGEKDERVYTLSRDTAGTLTMRLPIRFLDTVYFCTFPK